MGNPRGPDRRRKPTNPLSLASLFGRRRVIRRQEDRKTHYYVDRYDGWSIVVLLLVLLLSIADAYLTLRLVAAGAREMNPVMDFFLRAGVTPFLVAKYCLTGFGALFLIVHKEYPFFKGRVRGFYLLVAVLGLYMLLMVWELILLSRI